MSAPDTKFTRLPWWRRWFGARSERVAARYLRKQGLRIVAENVQELVGEIDLLAVEGRTLVVVEVRSSASKSFVELAESIDYPKQRRLTKAAMKFLKKRDLLNVAVRYDILLVRWPDDQSEPEIQHFRHAFDAAGDRYQMYE